ncbi:MAG: tetratricopeptide repeat protein [Candidatus Krumholzibacteriia bacterium]
MKEHEPHDEAGFAGRAAERFQEGRRAEQSGDLVAAAAAYGEALLRATAPPPEWHYRLGCVRLKQDDLSGAEEQFRAACELAPRCGRYLTNLGVVLDRRGRREDAVRSYQKAIFSEDATAATYHNLGAIYAEEGRSEDAARAFQSAIDLAADPEGYLSLGLVHLHREEFVEAVECFEEATRLDPRFARGQYFAGVCLLRQGVYAQAVRRFELALKIDPRLVRAQYHIGIGLHKLERFEEALAALQRALEAFPEDGRVHYRLALTYDALRRPHEARRHYSLARAPSRRELEASG